MLGTTQKIEDLITDSKTKGQGRTTWWQPQTTREDTMTTATVAITMATTTITTTVTTAGTTVIATIEATTTKEEHWKT